MLMLVNNDYDGWYENGEEYAAYNDTNDDG